MEVGSEGKKITSRTNIYQPKYIGSLEIKDVQL